MKLTQRETVSVLVLDRYVLLGKVDHNIVNNLTGKYNLA